MEEIPYGKVLIQHVRFQNMIRGIDIYFPIARGKGRYVGFWENLELIERHIHKPHIDEQLVL